MASGSQTWTANAINSSHSYGPVSVRKPLRCLLQISLSHWPTNPAQFTSALQLQFSFTFTWDCGLAWLVALPGLDWSRLVWAWQSVSVSVSIYAWEQPAVLHLIVTFELLSYCRNKLIVKSCNCLTMLANIISFCGKGRRQNERAERTEWTEGTSTTPHTRKGRTHPSRHNPCAYSSV